MPGLQEAKLFGRAFKLVVGVPDNPDIKVEAEFDGSDTRGLDVSGFDIDFTIEKTLKPEPNTCDIKVYNLSEVNRKILSGSKLTVKLEAGYKGATSLLYFGEVRAAWTDRQGPDFITHLESGDGEKEIAKSRINVARGAKVPIFSALSSIVEAIGVGQGNVGAIESVLLSRGIASINGGSLTGSAASRLTDLCRSAGLEWSIQNGAIQILDIGKTISTQALTISSDTGMIESPTVDSGGILSVTTLIIPGLQPGVLVNMDSLFYKGGYRIERCKWAGQIYGNNWQCSWEAKKY